VRKRGIELFVPPNVCRSSHFNPKVPVSFKFFTSDEILESVQLEGFDKVIEAYDNINSNEDFMDYKSQNHDDHRFVVVNKKIQAQQEV